MKINVSDAQLRVVFEWEGDDLYRPCVGFFVDDRIVDIAACRRRPRDDGMAGPWPCEVSVSWRQWFDGDHSARRLRVVVLESGQTIYYGTFVAPFEEKISDRKLDVNDLIYVATMGQSSWPCGGFEAYLQLPLNDQIELLYRDILGRGADAFGLQAFAREIFDRQITLLDLRDRMLSSDEFRFNRFETVVQRLGQWIVWTGLEVVADKLREDRSAFIQQVGTAEFGEGSFTKRFAPGLVAYCPTDLLPRHLARLACGSDADGEVLDAWELSHGVLIKRLQAIAEYIGKQDSATVPLARSPTSSLNYGDLLSLLHVGSVGRRAAGGAIHSDGTKGCVAYGPYIRLFAGQYRLKMQIQVDALFDNDYHVVNIELVYKDLVLGRLDIGARDFARVEHDLCFEVAADRIERFPEPAFEVRVHSATNFHFELSALLFEKIAVGSRRRLYEPEEWLPALNVGSAGDRLADGTIRATDKTGNMFHGPYRKLLPGRYIWTVEFVESEPDELAVSHVGVTLDVTSAGAVIAQRRFDIRRGTNLLEIGFTITEANTDQVIEVRLEKLSGGSLSIKSVRLRSFE